MEIFFFAISSILTVLAFNYLGKAQEKYEKHQKT